MTEGTVKWFNPRKGYGFIATPDGRDIFVHYASIAGDGYKTLAEGDAVNFDVVEGEKGLRAENVVQSSAAKSGSAPKEETASEGNEEEETASEENEEDETAADQ